MSPARSTSRIISPSSSSHIISSVSSLCRRDKTARKTAAISLQRQGLGRPATRPKWTLGATCTRKHKVRCVQSSFEFRWAIVRNWTLGGVGSRDFRFSFCAARVDARQTSGARAWPKNDDNSQYFARCTTLYARAAIGYFLSSIFRP